MTTKVLVKVHKIDDNIERELSKFGSIQLVSEIFGVYSVNTTHKKRMQIEKLPYVISVRTEENCSLLPI